jgi:hypothetical protein
MISHPFSLEMIKLHIQVLNKNIFEFHLSWVSEINEIKKVTVSNVILYHSIYWRETMCLNQNVQKSVRA